MLKIPNTMISIEAHSMTYDRNGKTELPYNSVLISVYLYASCRAEHRTTFVHLFVVMQLPYECVQPHKTQMQ